MTKEEMIKKRLEQYEPTFDYKGRQNRLKALVESHGVRFVAMASGLTEKTLIQYVRVRSPQAISEATVTQAESVLEGL